MEGKLPEDLQSSLEKELASLKGARAEKGASADYVSFMERVASAIAKARAAIRALDRPPTEGAGEGLLSAEEVGFEPEILRQFLRELEGASGGEGKENHLRGLADASDEDPGVLKRVATAASFGEDARPLKELADSLKLPVHGLLMVGRLLSIPFFMEARTRRGARPEIDMRETGRHEGEGEGSAPRHLNCPTCGSAPGLAVLARADGSRRLLCLLCGEAWLAPRLMCASCGNKEQSKLATLYVTEDDPRWVEVCEACRRYLKTVDESRLPEGFEALPRAEEARSLYLDLMAEQEGYVRSAL